MGINSIETLNLLDETLDKLGFEYTSSRMCEMGNQRMWGSLNLENTPRRFKRPGEGDGYFLARDYFLINKKMEHFVSIDLNGRDGALRLDLTKEFSKYLIDALKGPFNVITNFGTSEHVPGQYECFRNMHDLCDVGGVMYHVVPRIGSWDGKNDGLSSPHCPYYYDTSFFEQLASLNNYEIIVNKVWNHDHVTPQRAREECVCIVRKNSQSEFVSKDEFDSIPIHYLHNPGKTGDYCNK